MAITYHAGRRIQGNTFEDSYWKLYDSAVVNMGSTLGNEGTGAWTHSVWHKADSTDSVTIYNKYDGAGGDIGFYLAGTQGGNGYYFYDLDYPTYHVELKSGVQPRVGEWDHIVITRSSSGVFKIYVNGVFPTHSNNTQTSTNSINNSADWIFANHSAGDSNIADFTFWERELSASEVLSIYENGNDSISQTGLIHHYNFEQTGTSLTDQVGSINGTRSGGETGLTRDVQDYKPTDVQVGSRYEETNTRKMYNYTESDTISSTPASWGDFSSTTGSQNIGVSSTYKISAQKIYNSSSNLNGKTIGKIGLALRLISGTGTATAGVFNSSGAILHTFGTIDISTLSTGYDPYTWYDFTGTSSYTLSVGEYVGIKMTSGSGSMNVAHRDSGSQYDGGNSYWDRWNGSAWSGSFTSLDLSIKLYVETTGGTFTWQEIGT